MKVNTIILFVLLIARLSSIDLYSAHQELTPSGDVEKFDFTQDLSTLIISAQSLALDIFVHTDFNFSKLQTVGGGPKVDVTNDGAFLVSCALTEGAHIRSRNVNRSYDFQFTSYQSSTFVEGCSFFQDGTQFIKGQDDTAGIYLVRGGAISPPIETLSGLATYVTDIKITPDASKIAIASRQQVDIFEESGGSYTQLQQIDLGAPPGYDDMEVSMTDDGNYFSSNYWKQALLYKLNSGTGQYDLWQNITTISSVLSTFFNNDQNLFLVTTAAQTLLYRIYQTGANQLLQTFEGGSYSKITKDNSFLMIGGPSFFKIYRHCQDQAGYEYDSDTVSCSEAADSGSGSENCSVEFCLTCVDSDPQVCEVCMDDYFVIGGECNNVTTAVIAGSVVGGVTVVVVAAILIYVFVIKKAAVSAGTAVGGTTTIVPEQLSKGAIIA